MSLIFTSDGHRPVYTRKLWWLWHGVYQIVAVVKISTSLTPRRSFSKCDFRENENQFLAERTGECDLDTRFKAWLLSTRYILMICCIFVFREIEICLWELKYLKIPEVVWFSSRAVRITLITRQNLHFHWSMCIHSTIGYLWGYLNVLVRDSVLWSDFSLWNPTPTGPRRRKRRIWSFDGEIRTTLRIQEAADVFYA